MKQQPTILIIEDDRALNHAYVTILVAAGYRVESAFDGKAALELTARQEPDIIFLDLRMPTLDGIGFLKAYEPKTLHENVEIVVFSNYDLQKEIDTAYQLGAQRYVLKARATPKELISIVEDIITTKSA